MSTPTQVARGSSVRARAVFAVAGVLTDPTTVTLEVLNPAKALTTYTYAGAQITKEALGIFYRDVLIDTRGRWHFRMTGTGTVPASDWHGIECTEDPFT